MDLGRYKIVKDPVHGYIKIYEHELSIVDTFAFQRLRKIKQLSVADIVYPGATHTRFSHSLGVAHVTEALVRDVTRKYRVKQYDLERYVVIMRFIALLHDIGHGPFSHAFEDFILIPKGITHEDVGAEIVLQEPQISSVVERIVSEYGYKLSDVSAALKCTKKDFWPFKENIYDGGSEKALFYILKGVYSADIIDYLLRDSYYTGAGYGSNIDWYRISYYLGVVGDNIVIDYRALDALELLMLARMYMFSTVYYHKTVRAATKFLGDIMSIVQSRKIMDFNNMLKNVGEYIKLNDESFLFNPSVYSLNETRDFLSRKIPYKLVAEYRIPLANLRTPIEFINRSKVVLENILEQELKRKSIEVEKDKDFFIDTPKLSLNPMLGSEEIIVMLEGGQITRKSIFDFTWFNIPKFAILIRLYIRRELRDKAQIIRDVFNELFSYEEMRSFY
ncbi:HD domain-containing protein [Ignisphaera sp. 4213-co]|uniref:HD domain-containing protein n=1 Tax=Ignisphaera cupida TaxID=3050454 RepID=A0ABD4Z509_9CREN|nr:HD domain-containing protein [Ignisphaera sp. 4213-co]MDK6028235.1 HD domain-containing protein [Ignisphaera sp. 4213-co]